MYLYLSIICYFTNMLQFFLIDYNIIFYYLQPELKDTFFGNNHDEIE